MRAYGHKRKEVWCCPGHDKWPWKGERVRNRNLKNKPAKSRARREGAVVVQDWDS